MVLNSIPGLDDEFYDGDDGDVQNENKWNLFQRTGNKLIFLSVLKL